MKMIIGKLHCYKFATRAALMTTVLTMTACSTTLQTSGTANVAGDRIAYFQSGQGSPTAVFESGLGDGKGAWASVLPEIAKLNWARSANFRES